MDKFVSQRNQIDIQIRCNITVTHSFYNKYILQGGFRDSELSGDHVRIILTSQSQQMHVVKYLDILTSSLT